MKKKALPLFFVKWLNYEYWPFWLFFMPMVPYWLYLAFRAKSLTYFTAANPGIEHSGVFGESKIDILNKIDKRYLPGTIFLKAGMSFDEIKLLIIESGIIFPFIVKPNVGERGTEVEKIESWLQLESYLAKTKSDLIIQEFVGYDIELGVLYFRFPNTSETGITSVVTKEFLSVTGDGESSIQELLEQNDRARFQIESLSKKLGCEMGSILTFGETRNLEPIGNHCKGTKFLSGMDLLNAQLVTVFDDIAKGIDGFYFGRFDLKVRTVEDLYKGETIKILELNGVTSEPGHIYDPSFSLRKAYSEIAKSMKVMFRVSKANIDLGVKVTPTLTMVKLIRAHFNRNEPVIQKNLKA